MEARLKALKVVELKEILNKANVAIPAKANKPDLIAKIIASPDAIDVFEGRQPGASNQPTEEQPEDVYAQEEPPAPQEQFDQQISDSTQEPSVASKPVSAVKSPPASPKATTTTSDSTSTDATAAPAPAEEDEEAIKRRKRAERFGIPVVQPKQPKPRKNTMNGSEEKRLRDPDTLKSRAERFGLGKQNTTSSTGEKRAAPKVEEVDAEELERRKKRALRFGLPA